MPKGNAITLMCCFCYKSKKEVVCLIVGPLASICNECIDVSNDIIIDQYPSIDIGDNTDTNEE